MWCCPTIMQTEKAEGEGILSKAHLDYDAGNSGVVASRVPALSLSLCGTSSLMSRRSVLLKEEGLGS